MKEAEKCTICGEEAQWVENSVIYGRNYGKSYMIWFCTKCGAYVGCHNNTKKPKGTFADKELRRWRMKAHNVIDPLWKNGHMERKTVYRKLRHIFGREFHIGESTVEDCKKLIENKELLFNSSGKLFEMFSPTTTK